jgi:hypothetical protein
MRRLASLLYMSVYFKKEEKEKKCHASCFISRTKRNIRSLAGGTVVVINLPAGYVPLDRRGVRGFVFPDGRKQGRVASRPGAWRRTRYLGLFSSDARTADRVKDGITYVIVGFF